MDRKNIVRLQFQRMIGGVFILASLVLFGVAWGKAGSIASDVSGAILVAVIGLWMLFSKEYIFWTGENGKQEN